VGLFGKSGTPGDLQSLARQQAWSDAIQQERLPDFVTTRLKAAGDRKVPWLSTMTPAELLLGKSHGMRPVATVSGTCWAQFGTGSPTGYLTDEWGNFALGWAKAVERMKREALAAGANAVVDVQMRSSPSPHTSSADFTVFGTAIRFDRLPASSDPVIATVSALDFVRLLEMGTVVCGMAIGSAFDFIYTPGTYTETRPFGRSRALLIAQQMKTFSGNQAVGELSDFWQEIRRRAHLQLRQNTQKIGGGVLARTNLSQLRRVEGEPANYFGRHIVIGTVVTKGRAGRGVQDIHTVVDMRDDQSPFCAEAVTEVEAVLTAGLGAAGKDK
jgi:hypothetical protein